MVSWHAVATHFADRGTACALVDRSTNIRLFSAGLEKLVGRDREAVEGQPWAESLAPAVHVSTARARMERALSGTLRAFESEVSTASGARLLLSLEANLVGRDDEQGMLLTVTAARPLDLESGTRLQDEVDYDISASMTDFGRILAMRTPSGPMPLDDASEERCFALLQGRSAPCPDCPALHQGAHGGPRTVVRRLADKDGSYQLVTAEPQDGKVRVRLRCISDEVLAAIHESKIAALAEAARLSERERAVLTYLLMGRSLTDIGVILDISPRTVKFHQANVLEKLGADSRADLVRLIT